MAGQRCSTCGGSPAGLYPGGRLCAGCAPPLPAGMAYAPVPPENLNRTSAVLEAAPCRICGRPSWRADGDGPVHECCLAWRHVIEAGYPCPSCRVAEIVLRQYAAMASRPADKRGAVRLPALPPLPRSLPDGTPFIPYPPARPADGPVYACCGCMSSSPGNCPRCGQPMQPVTRQMTTQEAA
jgi:hypothetical protein